MIFQASQFHVVRAKRLHESQSCSTCRRICYAWHAFMIVAYCERNFQITVNDTFNMGRQTRNGKYPPYQPLNAVCPSHTLCLVDGLLRRVRAVFGQSIGECRSFSDASQLTLSHTPDSTVYLAVYTVGIA